MNNRFAGTRWIEVACGALLASGCVHHRGASLDQPESREGRFNSGSVQDEVTSPDQPTDAQNDLRRTTLHAAIDHELSRNCFGDVSLTTQPTTQNTTNAKTPDE